MKSPVSMIVALGLVVAFVAPAFAGGTGSPTTKEACQAAGMHWDDKSNTCHKTQKN